MQKRCGNTGQRGEGPDWGGVGLVALLLGALLTLAAVLRLHPAFAPFEGFELTRPVFTVKQTLAVGATLLGSGLFLMLRALGTMPRMRPQPQNTIEPATPAPSPMAGMANLDFHR